MSILQKVNRLLFCVFYEFLKYFLQHLNKNETTYGVKDVYANNTSNSELLKCWIIFGSRPPFLDIFLQNPCRNEYYVFLQLLSTMVVGTKYKNGHFYLSAQLIWTFSVYANKWHWKKLHFQLKIIWATTDYFYICWCNYESIISNRFSHIWFGHFQDKFIWAIEFSIQQYNYC